MTVRWIKMNWDDRHGDYCTQWPPHIQRNQAQSKLAMSNLSLAFYREPIRVNFVQKTWRLSKYSIVNRNLNESTAKFYVLQDQKRTNKCVMPK